MTRRPDLTDRQWAVLAPLLPAAPRTGRPPKWEKRQLIDGIRWRIRIGAPWRDVPAEYAPWPTVYSGHTISFLPVGCTYTGSLPPGGRPMFRSDGTPGYWLWASLPAGHSGGDTGLRFYYLDISGYGAGGLAVVGPVATVNGLRRPTGQGMNANTVYGMRFHHMGATYSTDTVGPGGLTMWNSRNNTIRNNHFDYLENLAPTVGNVHVRENLHPYQHRPGRVLLRVVL